MHLIQEPPVPSLTRLLPALLLAASVGVLGTAFLFQHVGGLEPCILCIYERYPYGAAILLSGLALIFARRTGIVRLLVGATGAVFIASVVLALYHVGVEQEIFVGPTGCQSPVGHVESLEELRDLIVNRPIVRCDKPAWIFLGLSMAAWNAVASFGLAGLAIAAAALGRKRWT
jgi:disulfide bond formation protein DsbB